MVPIVFSSEWQLYFDANQPILNMLNVSAKPASHDGTSTAIAQQHIPRTWWVFHWPSSVRQGRHHDWVQPPQYVRSAQKMQLQDMKRLSLSVHTLHRHINVGCAYIQRNQRKCLWLLPLTLIRKKCETESNRRVICTLVMAATQKGCFTLVICHPH